jgi:hypothetical protein
VAGGYELLAKPAEAVKEIHAMAMAITGDKGNFNLRVDVGPYAEIVEVKIGDKARPVSDDEKWSPGARINNIGVGEGKLVLKHPDYGTIEVALKNLEANRVYVVRGLMSDKGSIKVVPQ